MAAMDQIIALETLYSMTDNPSLAEAFRKSNGSMTFRDPIVLNAGVFQYDKGLINNKTINKAQKAIEKYAAAQDKIVFWHRPESKDYTYISIKLDKENGTTVTMPPEQPYISYGVIKLSYNGYIPEGEEKIVLEIISKILSKIQEEDNSVTGIIVEQRYTDEKPKLYSVGEAKDL